MAGVRRGKLHGSGGGGGKGSKGGGPSRTAQEDPNTLRSRSYARVLDLLGEGEIEGLVNGLQSVFFDETPLQNSDGTYNFARTTVTTRVGSTSQSVLPGFDSTSRELAVAAPLTVAGGPLVRTITDPNVNAVRFLMQFPALTQQDTDDGDLHGSSVQFYFSYQPNGGSWVNTPIQTVTGKTTTLYERQYLVSLTGSAPWDIRAVRVTADSADAAVQNLTQWASYSEIIWAQFEYPDSALAGVVADAESFGGRIPSRAYEVKGLKIAVPSNYNPVTRAYTGIWNGSFQTAWTDNPVWVFYDLLTNERYGLGRFMDPAVIDIASLYTLAQYCDELVPDGYGGTEPRFTFNGVLQSREDAYNVLNAVASVFRGMIYWSAGGVFTGQDSPRDIDLYVSPANVVDGVFNYEGSSLLARHNSVKVGWNNPDDFYRLSYEVIEDNAHIRRYGMRDTEVYATGCTSRGQARRVGRFILASELNETRTVTYKAGFDHADVTPGMIIGVLDPVYSGAQFAGRVLSGDNHTLQVTLDRSVTLGAGAHTLSIMGSDGLPKTKTIVEGAGSYSTLTVDSAFFPELVNDPGFDFWTGGLPDQWTVVNADVNNTVTQAAGGGADFFSDGSAALSVKQTFTNVLVPGATYEVAITISNHVAGEVRPHVFDVTNAVNILNAPIAGSAANGTYYVTFTMPANSTSVSVGILRIVSATTDFRIEEVSVRREQLYTGNIFAIASASLEPQRFRVISVTEDEPGVYDVTALEHDQTKFEFIDRDVRLDPVTYTQYTTGPLQAPTALTLSESLYSARGVTLVKVILSWNPPPDLRVSGYEVMYRVDDENWVTTTSVNSSLTVLGAQPGIWEVEVRAVGGSRRSSALSALASQGTAIPVLGKVAPPPTIMWAFIDGDELTWEELDVFDLAGYRWKWHPGVNTSWGDANPMHTGLVTDSPWTPAILPEGTVTLMVRAVDLTGVESEDSAFIFVGLGDALVANVVQTRDEHALGFTGTITNGTVDGGTGDLEADIAGGLMWMANSLTSMWDFNGTAPMWNVTDYEEMTYEWTVAVTAAQAGSAMTVSRAVQGGYSLEYQGLGGPLMWTGDVNDMWVADADTPFWASIPPEFLPWPGSVVAKNQSYNFRLVVQGGGTQGVVSALAVVIDVPDVVERLNDVVISGAGTTRLPITKTFNSIVNVSLTLQDDAGTAVAAVVFDKDEVNGPLVKCYDVARALTSGTVDAIIQGT